MVHVDSSDPGDTQSGFGLSTGSLIGPIQLYGNTDLLGLRGCGAGTLSWVKTGCVAHGHFCLCYTSLYTDHDTDTRCVTALQSYTAIQRYTALYIMQLYIAMQPLQHPSGLRRPRSWHRRPRSLRRLERAAGRTERLQPSCGSLQRKPERV